MEAVLPFSSLVKVMQPFYLQVGPQVGRPPYGLEVMLRIHLMQNWWSLRDDAMESLENIKALSQKTVTPLLQQGF